MLAIGEAKSGETMSRSHLTRLRHAMDLIRVQQKLPEDFRPKLLLFSGTGFTPELVSEAEASDGMVQLIGLDRLYA